MQLPVPGVYPDVPREVYDAWPAANHSKLVKFNDSAAHALEFIEHPPPPTPALHLGQAVHQAVLEPQRFDEEWVKGLLAADGVSTLPRRSNKDKAEWAEFEKKNHGKGILKAGDWALCQELRHACWAHPQARQLLGAEAGLCELSCIFLDNFTGLPCKMRLDRLTTYGRVGAIVELKTAVNGSFFSFGRQAANLGYFSQAYQYKYGLEMVPGGDVPRRFFWIVVEKTPPYVVCVYEATPSALEAGALEYQKQILAYAECNKTGVWPGYSNDIEQVWVPKWARGQVEDEEGLL